MKTPNKSIVFYDSLTAFHSACPLPENAGRRSRADSWSGNQTYSEAYRNLWSGDEEAIKRSDKILERLESDGIELLGTQWNHAIVGYIPCVPSYLANDPESMLAPEEYLTDRSPMKVYASVCLSAGFDAHEVENRGIAILALVRKLTLVRPVELFLYSDQQGKQPVIKLETTPLDLTTASYATSNPAFLRKLCFAWGEADNRGFGGSWARWGGGDVEEAREALACDPQDLVITGSYLGKDILSDTDATIKWVNDHVKKYADTLE